MPDSHSTSAPTSLEPDPHFDSTPRAGCAPTGRWARLLVDRRWPLIVAALAVVLTLPALFVGIEADDYFLRVNLLKMERFPDLVGPASDLFAFSYGDPPRVHRLMDAGIAPWWTLPELKLAFCRPLSSLSHWLDYQLWPNSFELMHAHNLLLFALYIAGAAVVFRRVMGVTAVAGFAALLFAIDDGHANPAGWIAGRNTLLAAAFGVWCVAAHDAWRRAKWRPGAVMGPVLFVLSLLSAEAGVATLTYLIAHAACLERGTWRKRAAGIAPYLVLVVIWRIVWAMRGYGVYGVGTYVDPVESPLRFARAVSEVAPILLLGQWALPPSDLYALYDLMNANLGFVVWAGAVLFLVSAALLMLPVLRGRPEARFWALAMLLSLLPICATAGFPMDRLLMFVSLGAIGLLAMFLQAVWRMRRGGPDAARRPRWWRCTAGLAVLFFIVHAIFAPVSLVARVAAPAGPKGLTDQFYVQLPDDEPLAERDIVVVNAPGSDLIGMFPVMRAVRGKTIPRRMRMLGPSLSPVTVTRENERTLRLDPDDGYLAWSYDRMLRSLEHPFAPGETIVLEGMTVEVISVTENGRPAAARFTFDVPLEDGSLLWLQWRDGAFKLFAPPPVGESVNLPRARPRTDW